MAVATSCETLRRMAGMKRGNRLRLFVGSSSESRGIAYAIQQNLDDDADVTVWDQNVFRLTKDTLSSLIEQLSLSDFAVFVFAPDDLTRLRKATVRTVRDNVLFELGLFMGALGLDKAFIVAPKGAKNLHIPTDLIGIMVGRYNAQRQDSNLRAALGPFCNDVRNELNKACQFRKLKITNTATRKNRGRPIHSTDEKAGLIILEALYGARDHRVNVARKLNSMIRNGELHVYVGNQLGGDPCPNTAKDIVVRYRYEGREERLVVPEKKDLILPKHRRAG